jgi:hypothetical protein
MLEFLEVIKWPLVFLICFLVALFVLRSAITKLFDRARRAGFGNKTIDFAPGPAAEQQLTLEAQKSTGESLSVRVEDVLPPPMEIYAPYEKEIVTTLEKTKYPPNIEKAWLIRAVAVNRVMAGHESIYRLILGSQLELLLAANSGVPPDLARAHEIFNNAKATFPSIYTNFAFEGWLHWVTSTTGLMSLQSFGAQQVLRTTPLGKDFLHYLVASGLTSPKPG